MAATKYAAIFILFYYINGIYNSTQLLLDLIYSFVSIISIHQLHRTLDADHAGIDAHIVVIHVSPGGSRIIVVVARTALVSLADCVLRLFRLQRGGAGRL